MNMHAFSSIDFNLDYTLDCGQVFRWEKEDEWWTGVVNRKVVRASQDIEDGKVLIDSKLPKSFFYDYFRMDDDLSAILKAADKDAHTSEAISKYWGLRLIRQEPWECIISYMLATASSIPTIKTRISNICRTFGEEIEEGYYSFPDAEALAGACTTDLSDCKLGFRTKRIQKAAIMVADGELHIEEIFELDYHGAKKKLMEVEGIGEKVADCILLFAFGKMESFPVDTHIKQIVEWYYADDPYFEGKMNNHKIGEWGRQYFGKYCGYAQEYLFYQKRLEGLK